MTRALRLGVGASLTCLRRCIQPSRHIRERYVDPERDPRLENLVTVQENAKLVNRQDHQVIIMAHVGYPDVELYTVKRFCKVIADGPETQLLDISATIEPGEEVWEAFPELSEDTDDDNLPDTENEPAPGQEVDDIVGLWGRRNDGSLQANDVPLNLCGWLPLAPGIQQPTTNHPTTF
eukprot:scaffold1863_cov85-Cylindrotheca_fusiformis.AAC.1